MKLGTPVTHLSQQSNWLFHIINSHDAIAGDAMSKDDYKDFVTYIIDLQKIGGKDISEYIDVASTRNDVGGSVYRLKGRVEPTLKCSHLATTTDASYIYDCVDSASQRRYSRLFNKISMFQPNSSSKALEDFEAEVHDIVRSYTSDPNGFMEISYARPLKGFISDPKSRLVWLTSFDDGDIESEAWLPSVGWRARADRVRDALGLSHYGSNGLLPAPGRKPHLLATLVLPRAAIPPGAVIKRPTPLDGAGRRFKACYGDLRKKCTSWGRTVDLSKVVGPRPHRGGREIVVENFHPTLPIRFTVLGVTKLPRNDWEPEKDPEFLGSLKRGRQYDQIASRLMKAMR